MIPEYRTWNGQGFDYCTLRARKGFSPQESGIWYDLIQTHPKGIIFGTLAIKGEEEIEQYTGLKDVKGNKIFEGDIVKSGWVEMQYGGPDLVVEAEGEIVFEDGYFGVGNEKNEIRPLFTLTLNSLHIIGNVHENPELLEAEK